MKRFRSEGRRAPASRLSIAVMLGFSALSSAAPAAAQIPIVIHGRIEDAVTRQPIAEVRVFSPDSSSIVYTDSQGAFAIPMDADQSLTLHAERLGYVAQRFELDPAAPTSISVLLLEPAPLVLEGVNVVEDAAVTRLLRDLNNRRNFYQGPLRVFDRVRLERFAPVGSVWDLVRQQASRLFECSTGLSGLCARGRGRSFRNPYPEIPVLVCVDGWESWGAVSELSSLDVSSVALLELYNGGAGGIRVYTASYLLHAARTGRNIATPLWFGC